MIRENWARKRSKMFRDARAACFPKRDSTPTLLMLDAVRLELRSLDTSPSVALEPFKCPPPTTSTRPAAPPKCSAPASFALNSTKTPRFTAVLSSRNGAQHRRTGSIVNIGMRCGLPPGHASAKHLEFGAAAVGNATQSPALQLAGTHRSAPRRCSQCGQAWAHRPHRHGAEIDRPGNVSARPAH